MKDNRIYYRSLKTYKYCTNQNFSIKVNIFPRYNIETRFINLTTKGILTVKKNYCWDGPSGPSIDTKNFMKGSLVHDALYQLIRMGKLTPLHREDADKMLLEICRKDGMSLFRSMYVYYMVRVFGGFFMKRGKKETQLIDLEAP